MVSKLVFLLIRLKKLQCSLVADCMIGEGKKGVRAEPTCSSHKFIDNRRAISLNSPRTWSQM